MLFDLLAIAAAGVIMTLLINSETLIIQQNGKRYI